MTPNRVADPTTRHGSAAVAPQHCTDEDVSSASRSELNVRLACPMCASNKALIADLQDTLTCPSCTVVFPLVTCNDVAIPWLFNRPDVARLEWSARYKGFLNSNAAEHNSLNRALADSNGTSATRRRIGNELHARREHRDQVKAILAPVGLDGDDLVPAVTDVLNDNLPKNQGLSSYANNVFRDWAWNNGENEALFNAVEEVLCTDQRDAIGSVLTLGAGACRLPYDIHRKFSPSVSVALDFNPLLLVIGSRVIHGEHVQLYEFPIAPLDEGASAVLQYCRAPAALDRDMQGEFRFVLGDASNPPFASKSFDTVVTPWLIDIIPQDFRDFVPHVNRLLPEGGIWVNTGSLAFFHQDPRRCYSEVEVLEIVERNGFEVLTVDRRTVPYLQSPNSAHGRVERIVSFAARKRVDVEPVPPLSHLPEWIIDTTRSIPSSTDLVLASSSHLLTAQVLSAIDGKRSIDAIGRLVAREYDLSIDECIHSTRRILINAREDRDTIDGSWQF